MQTRFSSEFVADPGGRRADEILRSCVHCGFCNATCPTYQLLGDELDGPRGRIYLIQDLLEAEDRAQHGHEGHRAHGGSGEEPRTAERAEIARTHLDRCLTCRACETTCPSGVAYGELLEIGRERLERRHKRGWVGRIKRAALLRVVPYPRRFAKLMRLAALARPLLPAGLAARIPPVSAAAHHGPGPGTNPSPRKVVLLQGCVQRVSTPQVNEALTSLLARAGIAASVVPTEGCCGGLSLHLGEGEQARATMRANIDALLPHLEESEAVISSASGCGVTLKEYGRLLADDPRYAAKAARLSRMVRDAGEFVASLELRPARRKPYRRIAWHSPCTLQHGQGVSGGIESLLQRAGYELVPVREPGMCCGSAGSYSIFQPRLAERLRRRKLDALSDHKPEAIATANVGCQLHLVADPDDFKGVGRWRSGASNGTPPVLHWLELLG